MLDRGTAAQAILEPMLTHELDEATHVRARFMLALASLEQGLGQQALHALDDVQAEGHPAQPYVMLTRARAAAMAGKHGMAIELLGDLIEQFPVDWTVHDAHAERAAALFASDRCVEAASAYEALLERYPEYPQRHVAMYRQAQCLIQTGDAVKGGRLLQKIWLEYPWKEEGVKARIILDAWQIVGQGPSEPSDQDLLERGITLRRTKHWLVARRELGRLLKQVEARGKQETALINEIRLQLALNDYERQDYDSALPQLLELERRTRSSDEGEGLKRDFVRKILQRCHHRMGRSDKAEALLKERYAGRSKASRQEALAEFYWEDGRYKEAWTLTNSILKERDKDDWDFAFLTYKAGRYAQAARLFRDLIRSSRRSSERVRYRYWLARTLQRQNQSDAAVKLFKEVVDQDTFGYYGYQAANRLYDIAQEQTPKAPEHIGALFTDDAAALMVRWSDLGCEDHSWNCAADLIAATDQGAQSTPTPTAHPYQARVYWSGPEEAPAPKPLSAKAFARMAPDQMMTAYVDHSELVGSVRTLAKAHRSLWPSLDRVAFLHEVGLHREAQLEMRTISLEYWRLLEAHDDGDHPKSDQPLDLKGKRWGHLIDHRGSKRRGFWGLGARRDLYPIPKEERARGRLAKRQTRIVRQRHTIGPLLQRALMEVGDHYVARKLRLMQGGWDRNNVGGDSRKAWTELHPRAFALLVQKYAAREGLNPYILWALMTVESAYNPDSVSYADARGLLQVIPKTGNKVADDIRDNTFGGYDLLTPETSIRHGAWYFARLVRKFNGQEPFAIASYNGGPHNVHRWLRHKDHIPLDEFVEEIPFTQARGYTKKVLRFVALYRAIYEDTEGIYIGQTISPKILADPRY
ncbi:MAG: transglycosylase SLT domain-containing protein [Myxococcota bacterium]